MSQLEAERQKTAAVDVSGVERQLAVERVRAEAMDGGLQRCLDVTAD